MGKRSMRVERLQEWFRLVMASSMRVVLGTGYVELDS